MAKQIRKQVAQQIVETVKDVSGRDINFIDQNGRIFASTDPDRVGNFHEIGQCVIKTGEAIEVETDDTYLGTHRGVNLPFSYRGEVIAAIGISGPPEEVRKFAALAQQITALILREQELDEQNGNEKARLNFIIRALTGGEAVNREFLTECLSRYRMKPEDLCRTVIVRRKINRETVNLSLLESKITGAFEEAGSGFFTFVYPGDYLLIIEEDQYQKNSRVFHRLAERNRETILIGTGNAETVIRQDRSFEAARIALSSLSGDRNIAIFDDLDLEILLGSVPDGARERFLKKVADELTNDDFKLLNAYFAGNLSLKAVSDSLYLHKNTVQYRLDRIARKTGRNPRSFTDAVILYLALRYRLMSDERLEEPGNSAAHPA